MSDIYQGIRSILEDDPRYSRAAYFFLFEALEHTLKLREQDGHVSVENLLEGIRLLAIARFGLLAKTVFNDWGVHATEDFGEIVFNLIERDLMRKTDSDSRDDFADGYDFEVAFVSSFQLEPEELELPRDQAV